MSWLVLADASRDDLMESVSCYVHRVCLQSSAIWRFRCERAGGLLSPASVYLWPSATVSQRAVFTCVAECDQCATCRDTFGRVRLVRNVPCASVFGPRPVAIVRFRCKSAGCFLAPLVFAVCFKPGSYIFIYINASLALVTLSLCVQLVVTRLRYVQ